MWPTTDVCNTYYRCTIFCTHIPDRLSREEKTYNRALEQALKVSQVASGTTSVLSEVSDASDTISKDEEGDEFIPDDDEPDLTDHEEEGVSDENDDSDFNSSPPTKTKSVKKHQAKRTLSTIKQKSPANGKSKKSLPKLSRTPKDEVQTNMTSNSTPATPKGSTVLETNLKLVTQKAVGPSTPKSCPPSSVSRNIGIGRKVPKWTPPSRVGEGSKLPNTVNTSGTPVIRVGLSRHARVKPLHVSRT